MRGRRGRLWRSGRGTVHVVAEHLDEWFATIRVPPTDRLANLAPDAASNVPLLAEYGRGSLPAFNDHKRISVVPAANHESYGVRGDFFAAALRREPSLN